MVDKFLDAAIQEARQGLRAGGIPIGSVLVIDGEIVGRGHNKRIQRSSSVLHAEIDCLEDAGRLTAAEYKRSVLYSTLSPCDMCSGAVLQYKFRLSLLVRIVLFKVPRITCDHAGFSWR